MWTCPNCATQNDDSAPMCVVCATGAHAKAYGAPVDPWAAPSDAADLATETPASTGPLTVTGPIPTAPSVDPWATEAAPPVEPPRAEPTRAEPPRAEPPRAEPTKSEPAAPTTAPSAELPLHSPYGGRTGQYPPSAPQAPVKRRASPLRWVLPILLVALVGAGIVIGRVLSDRDDNKAQPGSAATSGVPGRAPASSPPASAPASASPSAAGPTENSLVTISNEVDDPRATAVAKTFDTYFSGVNEKDYDKAGAVLDPNGSATVSDLAKGTKSTSDSNVTLVSVGDSSQGRVTAKLTFRSTQDPGDGPKGRENETCTKWTITYTLNGRTYQILKSKASNSSC